MELDKRTLKIPRSKQIQICLKINFETIYKNKLEPILA